MLSRTGVLSLLAITAAGFCNAPVMAGDSRIARREVMASITAVGGEQVLTGVHRLEFHAVGHRNMLEQSLRPNGPWWQDYFQWDELRDFDTQGERINAQHRGYSSPEWWLRHPGWDNRYLPDAVVISGGAAAQSVNGKYSRASSAYLQNAREDFAFGPRGLLQTALAAADLHAEPDVVFHGFRQRVVAFTWRGHPVRVYLNGYTNLPAVVQWTAPRPYDVFWNVWGDVTTRITYGMWSLEPDGLRYPRQWSIERNGFPDRDVTITSLSINPVFNPKALKISADVSRDFLAHARTVDDLPLGIAGQPAAEIEPGVIHIPGYWNINLVRQPDGVVVLEGPLSSAYSVKVLAEAHARFPNLPVKAVVTTSDSWPHIGGLREYVARGIPIYALDLDKPILERLFKAPHTFGPDDLQKHPRAPKWRLFAKDTTLGTGPNRLELIPYRTETGERQTLVYFPQYRLLYTSDLFAPDQGDTWFTPEYLLEVRHAVRREQLAVDKIFGMHYNVTPWKAVTAALDRFLSPSTSRSASHPTAPVADPPQLAAALQPLAFFDGRWNCAGRFLQNGKSINATETFAVDLGGHWLSMRHDDHPPFGFHALELWGHDKISGQFVGHVFDNFSGIRHFISPGWTGDRFTLTNAVPINGLTDRFVFERKTADAYQVTYFLNKDGKNWRAVDSLLCRRQ